MLSACDWEVRQGKLEFPFQKWWNRRPVTLEPNLRLLSATSEIAINCVKSWTRSWTKALSELQGSILTRTTLAKDTPCRSSIRMKPLKLRQNWILFIQFAHDHESPKLARGYPPPRLPAIKKYVTSRPVAGLKYILIELYHRISFYSLDVYVSSLSWSKPGLSLSQWHHMMLDSGDAEPTVRAKLWLIALTLSRLATLARNEKERGRKRAKSNLAEKSLGSEGIRCSSPLLPQAPFCGSLKLHSKRDILTSVILWRRLGINLLAF